jgi:hypothetical protein
MCGSGRACLNRFKNEGHGATDRRGKRINVTPIAPIENASCLDSSSVRSRGEEAYVEMSQPFEELEAQPFEILEVQTREYSIFNRLGTQWNVRLNPPPEKSLPDPVAHFVDSMNNLFDRVLQDVGDTDMVGITIHNEVNQSDKHIGFSFRRKDQLLPNTIWSVFDKVSKSNARINSTDTRIVTDHSVTMPVGFGGNGTNRKGRPLATMTHLKCSIVEMRGEENCLAHAFVIAIARLNTDANYRSYRKDYKYVLWSGSYSRLQVSI